ncbi:MAG: hypothetical protein L6E13_12195 [Firmicutes bacterium]|nr:hypothetical protein [Bacillota bacterium]
MPDWVVAAPGWVALALVAGALLLAGWWVAGKRRGAGRRRKVPILSLVLLVRNQAPQVEGVVRLLGHYLQGQQVAEQVDLLVVDCGSADDTPAILERLGQQCPGLRVVAGPADPGWGNGPADSGGWGDGWHQPLARAQTSPWEPAATLAQGRLLVVLNLLGATEVRPLIESAAALLGHRTGERALAGARDAHLPGVEGWPALEGRDLAGPLRMEGAEGHIRSPRPGSEG